MENFRFRDWKDFKHDKDVYNGRLCTIVGYTTLDQIPMLLGLRQILDWLLEEELLEKIPEEGYYKGRASS